MIHFLLIWWWLLNEKNLIAKSLINSRFLLDYLERSNLGSFLSLSNQHVRFTKNENQFFKHWKWPIESATVPNKVPLVLGELVWFYSEMKLLTKKVPVPHRKCLEAKWDLFLIFCTPNGQFLYWRLKTHIMIVDEQRHHLSLCSTIQENEILKNCFFAWFCRLINER